MCAIHWLFFSAGLSPGSSHDTSLTSRASSAEGAPAHLTPFSTKRLDREFERKLQEVFVSVQLEKVHNNLPVPWRVKTEKQSNKQVKMMSNFLPEIGVSPTISMVSKLLTARRGGAIFRVLSSARGIFVTWGDYENCYSPSFATTILCRLLNLFNWRWKEAVSGS